MTPEQIRLVQASWADVRPVQTVVASLFYGRLFELAPDTRPLFTREIHAQGALLTDMLDRLVSGLGRPGEMRPALQQLAGRHTAYGVQPHHCESAGTALLWTLEQALGAAFTPAVHDAWQAAYGALAQQMQAAADSRLTSPRRAWP